MRHCVPAESTGYALITVEEKPSSRHKMEARAMEVRLIGYPEDVEGAYKVNTKDGRILIRRDVKWNDFGPQSKILSEYDKRILYNESD